MEASGQARWFEGLLGELQFELWIGDAAEIRTRVSRSPSRGEFEVVIMIEVVTEEMHGRTGFLT